MEKIKFINSSLEALESNRSKKESLEKRWLLTLYFCGLGGLIIGLTGLVMSGLSYFKVVESGLKIHKIGTILIVIAFPFIMFGAHALDKIRDLQRKTSV